MLTPPLHPDADSDDPGPPHRSTGFRLHLEPHQQLSQVLFKFAGYQIGEIRAYSIESGARIPCITAAKDFPLKISLQVFSDIPSYLRDESVTYTVFYLRKLSLWELWDNCSADFDVLDRQIQPLTDQVHALQTQLDDLRAHQS